MVTKDIYRDWVLCEAEEIVTRIETGYVSCEVCAQAEGTVEYRGYSTTQHKLTTFRQIILTVDVM